MIQTSKKTQETLSLTKYVGSKLVSFTDCIWAMWEIHEKMQINLSKNELGTWKSSSLHIYNALDDPMPLSFKQKWSIDDHFIMFESCKSIFDKTIYLLSPLFFGCSLFVIVSDQDIWLISSFSSFDLVSCSKCLVPKRYIGSYFTLTSKEWVIMKTDVIIDTLYFGFMIPCWCLR